MKQHTRAIAGGTVALFTLGLLVVGVRFGLAFTGPSTSGGVGGGALGVDSANNISVGTSTTIADTKLFVLASSSNNLGFAVKVFQPGSGPLFLIRNDGTIGIGTTIPAGASTSTLVVGGNTLINGTLTATSFAANVNASNVTAGVFGSGNFAFPSSLGIATSTQVTLPAPLSVYGNGYISGSLGIATTTPSVLLSVGNATSGLVAVFGGGSGKIDVGTIDPPYTIGGKQYATYLPAMTGVKEETTGNAACRLEKGATGCSYVIDFSTAPKGSDLWLFSKVTDLKNNFDKTTVILSAGFSGRVWYEKDAAAKKLVLHAEANGPSAAGSALEISYRLTAPRFDAAEWPNAPVNGSGGFVIPE